MTARGIERTESSVSSQSDADSIVAPLVALLDQLEWVLRRLDDRQYAAQRALPISGTVGGHVRHCLDHMSALIIGATTTGAVGPPSSHVAQRHSSKSSG